MTAIEQTNRTILFEKINGRKHSLLSLLGGIEHKEGLSDEEIQELHKYLEVTSFEEFLRKFEPSVYVLLDTENKVVDAHIGEKEGNAYEKQVINTENSFFTLLLDLMDKKRNQRFSVSGYEKLLNQLIPNKPREEMLDMRKKLMEYWINGDKVKAEYCMHKMMNSYDNGIYLLELYLQEACVYLVGQKKEKNLYTKAILEKKKGYEIYPIKISKDILSQKILLSDGKKQEYEEFILKSTERVQLKHQKLMRYWLTLPCIREENKEKYQKSYQEYMELYGKLIKAYWYTAKPLMETMLGVREFFRQYSEVENGMSPVLIVSNFAPKEMNQEKNKKALQLYLETVNHKNFYYNTIWYAIIPRLIFVEREEKILTRERFKGSGEKSWQKDSHIEDVAALLSILQHYSIQSFISASVVEESTMDGFMKHGMTSFQASFKGLEHIEHKEYVIPCYPNFIVMKGAQAQRSLGYQLRYDQMEEQFVFDGMKMLYLSEIGIGAAYIAAGLQAACQCPKYLKKYYKNRVDEQIPGVAYRVDYKENGKRIATGMTTETLRWDKDILDKALHWCKGILFLPQDGRVVAVTSGTLNTNNSNHETVSSVQTITYMEMKISYVTQDFKQNLIVSFFQNRPGSIREQWGSSRECVNGLLKTGESLEYEIDEKNHTCTFKLLLGESQWEKTVFITNK